MTNNTQVARSPAEEFRGQIAKMDSEIKTALPPHIPVERFVRVVLTAVNANPDLINADRRSLLASAMKAAQDGLLPDGRDGAFVVFNSKNGKDANGKDVWVKKVQWMPMIGGILKKIRNSGELKSISAYVAYENDKFYYRLGDEEKIEHEPALDNPGRPRLVYAIAHTKDGGIYREVMTLAQVEKVRNVSKAKDSGPWKDWWDEMARKTVLRRLAKRLPTSADLDDLLRRDDDLYDFKGQRAEAPSVPFTPVVNPLKDDRDGGVVLEHDSGNGSDVDQDYGDQRSDDDMRAELDQQPASEDRASPDASEKSPQTAQESRAEDRPREEGPTSGNEQAAKPAKSAAVSTAVAKDAVWDSSEAYMEHMRDQLDAAASKAAVTDLWGASRADRGELLGSDEIATLTKYKEAALARIAAKGKV